MSEPLTQKIAELDALIRNGKGQSARVELLKFRNGKVPNTFRLSLASLARRADLPDLCIRLLHPLVRPAKGTPSRATAEDKAEYAAGLIKLGATTEAIEILKSLPLDSHPHVSMYLGFGCVAQWDYRGAIPLFEKAIPMQTHAYQKLICQVNLAAALVHERQFEKVTDLLVTLKKQTKASSPILYGNLLKLWAEMKTEMRNFTAARAALDEAERVFAECGGRDNFLIRKMKAVVQVMESDGSAESIQQLKSIQGEASQKNHFETIRDCDFYRALYTRNVDTLLHVYFGTPHESFRERLQQNWKKSFRVPDVYSWKLKGNAKGLNLIAGGNGSLKVGQNLQRLFCALISDFYRPMRIAPLHALVFPDDYFNPSTSPMKTFMVIRRLREWFKGKKIPLTIEENDSQYRLVATGNCTLLVPLSSARKHSAAEAALESLRDGLGASFSIKEARKFLNTSRNSALRIAARGVELGIVKRTGTGPATRYEFSAEIVRKAA